MVGTFLIQPSLARSMLALEPAELLHLDVARLMSLTQAEPHVAWEILMESEQVLRMTLRSYGIRTFGSIRLRVANAILDRALSSGPAGAGTVVIGTQHELANAPRPGGEV